GGAGAAALRDPRVRRAAARTAARVALEADPARDARADVRARRRRARGHGAALQAPHRDDRRVPAARERAHARAPRDERDLAAPLSPLRDAGRAPAPRRAVVSPRARRAGLRARDPVHRASAQDRGRAMIYVAWRMLVGDTA